MHKGRPKGDAATLVKQPVAVVALVTALRSQTIFVTGSRSNWLHRMHRNGFALPATDSATGSSCRTGCGPMAIKGTLNFMGATIALRPNKREAGKGCPCRFTSAARMEVSVTSSPLALEMDRRGTTIRLRGDRHGRTPSRSCRAGPGYHRPSARNQVPPSPPLYESGAPWSAC